MRICKKCGEKNDDFAVFCGNCGAILTESNSSVEQGEATVENKAQADHVQVDAQQKANAQPNDNARPRGEANERPVLSAEDSRTPVGEYQSYYENKKQEASKSIDNEPSNRWSYGDSTIGQGFESKAKRTGIIIAIVTFIIVLAVFALMLFRAVTFHDDKYSDLFSMYGINGTDEMESEEFDDFLERFFDFDGGEYKDDDDNDDYDDEYDDDFNFDFGDILNGVTDTSVG